MDRVRSDPATTFDNTALPLLDQIASSASLASMQIATEAGQFLD
jgi:hypothetical protein